MLLERAFWPVGHGGFFSERIFSYETKFTVTVVYDCGSLKDTKLCKSRILDFLKTQDLYAKICWAQLSSGYIGRSYNYNDINVGDYFMKVPSVECIDLLFISHFDRDHINCIAELASRVKINNVVIPYYDEYDLLYLRTTEDSSLLGNANDIITSLGLSKDTNVYRVLPEVGLDPPMEDLLIDSPRQITIGQGSGEDVTIRPKTQFCVAGIPDWIWAVFNYDRPNNTKNVRDGIQKLIRDKKITPATPEGLALRLNKQAIRTALNRIYKKNTTDKNSGSLVIFSGSTHHTVKSIHLFEPFAVHDLHIHYFGRCGFSYMGDYDAKTPERLEAYMQFIAPYKDQLGGIQVPHHGSSRNFSSELLNDTQWCMVAASSNDPKHPDAAVWAQMNLQRHAFLVDKKDSSLLIQICRI